jgi:hypothetical protein
MVILFPGPGRLLLSCVAVPFFLQPITISMASDNKIKQKVLEIFMIRIPFLRHGFNKHTKKQSNFNS